jgi:S1-C subfamily serine protease
VAQQESAPTEPAKVASRAPEPPPWTFDHWLQDFEQAQRRAIDEHKDVLLLFDASDWSEFSQHLAKEVFGRPELWKRITERFVPVHVDFPEYPRARRRVQDAGRNAALQDRFFKHPAYPRVVLTDSEGRPYGIEWGYTQGQAEPFVDSLEIHRQRREDRDELLVAVEAAGSEDVLPAAETALNFLARKIEGPTPREDGTYALGLVEFYAPLLDEWCRLADAHDPENQGGYRERFFRADWGRRWRGAMACKDPNPTALRTLAAEFDTWRARCPFRDANVGADLLFCRARLAAKLSDPAAVEREVRTALRLNPAAGFKKALVALLRSESEVPVGTGFLVAPGHVVTNSHVVQGPGAVRIRLQGREPVGCTVVAEDRDEDLALLRFETSPRVNLPMLRVAPHAAASRGTEVMALGFAGDGELLKFTRGSISARADDPGRGPPLLVLDQRINPGNSGGPLCDARGNVVGIVTAKTTASAEMDSYGIALVAETLDRFLGRHLKDQGYRTLPPYQQHFDWAELNRRISPGVVLVLKRPR